MADTAVTELSVAPGIRIVFEIRQRVEHEVDMRGVPGLGVRLGAAEEAALMANRTASTVIVADKVEIFAMAEDVP